MLKLEIRVYFHQAYLFRTEEICVRIISEKYTSYYNLNKTVIIAFILIFVSLEKYFVGILKGIV